MTTRLLLLHCNVMGKILLTMQAVKILLILLTVKILLTMQTKFTLFCSVHQLLLQNLSLALPANI